MSDIPPTLEELQQRIGGLAEEWKDNRRTVIDRIWAIAQEVDYWHTHDRKATVAGSAVGLAGGGLMLISFLFGPLVIPGVVMSLAGAGTKVGMSIARFNIVKGLAAEVQQLCEEDARRLTSFLDGADRLINIRSGAGTATAAAASAAMNTLRASISALRHTFVTVPNAAGGTSLRALLPAAAVGPIRIIAGATVGIGMAIDVASIISSVDSLANNEADALATQLREIANKLEEELKGAAPSHDG